MAGLGDVLLWVTLTMAVVAFILQLYDVLKGDDRWRPTEQWLSLMVPIGLWATFAYLVSLFITPDVSYLYVWSRSSTDLDIWYRIAASWAGSSGSMLLFAAISSLAAQLFVWRMRGRMEERRLGMFSTVSSGFVVIFLLVVILGSLFAPTVGSPDDAWRMAQYPNGRGLALSLQTWEMALHPLLVFTAYALCLLVFAAAMSIFKDREKKWPWQVMTIARVSWLLVTLGMAVGAWWAYFEAGWGGYWSWDPVETSSLIIWLALTAFLHSATIDADDRSMPSSAVFGMIPFLTVLFTIFVTRSGTLWAFSVHVYSAATGGGIGNRFIDLLAHNGDVLLLFITLVLTLLVVAWAIWKERKTTARTQRGLKAGSLGVIMPLLVAVILLLLMMKNVDVGLVPNYTEMAQKAPLAFSAVIVALIFCGLDRGMGRRHAVRITVMMVAGSAVIAAFSGEMRFDPLVILPITIFAFSAVIAVVHMGNALIRPGSRGRVSGMAAPLIHLGTVLVLIAYSVTMGFMAAPAEGNPVTMNVGDSVDVGAYTITLTDISGQNVTATGYNQVWTATVDITRGAQSIGTDVKITNYYMVDGPSVAKVKGQVEAFNALTEDVYMEFNLADSGSVSLTATLMPFMNVLWFGTFVLCIGIVVRTGYGFRRD